MARTIQKVGYSRRHRNHWLDFNTYCSCGVGIQHALRTSLPRVLTRLDRKSVRCLNTEGHTHDTIASSVAPRSSLRMWHSSIQSNRIVLVMFEEACQLRVKLSNFSGVLTMTLIVQKFSFQFQGMSCECRSKALACSLPGRRPTGYLGVACQFHTTKQRYFSQTLPLA